MVIGRLPMGTSFTVFPSNIRLSLGISVSSRGAVFARVFAPSRAQPGTPTFGVVLQTNNDDGDVVDAAVFIGDADQSFGRFLRIGLCLQSACDFRIGNHSSQTVGTQKKQVARKESLLFGIDFDFSLRAESAKQDALHFALLGLAGADDSGADLLRHKRVIAGQLLQSSVAKQVSAAVADVSDAEGITGNPKRG